MLTLVYLQNNLINLYLSKKPFSIRHEELVSKFSEIVLDWKMRGSENIRQGAILAKLRETLLPKLMSGELRIADAAALVDEAI